MSSIKARDYCYTLNNYSEEQYEKFKLIPCRYQVIGKEVGESGTRHLQGYIYFVNPRSFDSVRKLLDKCHLEITKGKPKEASDYCKKDGDFWEIGDIPEQGKRTDVELVREQLKMGNGIRGVVKIATNLQQIKIAESILCYEEPKRDWEAEVFWYWGLTGTGKSRDAHKMFEGTDYYRKTAATGKWWPGYDGQENVIIDDIDPTVFPYKVLLDLLDRYETRIECKGGSRQFLAKKIIITSSDSPAMMFGNQSQGGDELLRRINHIVHF